MSQNVVRLISVPAIKTLCGSDISARLSHAVARDCEQNALAHISVLESKCCASDIGACDQNAVWLRYYCTPITRSGSRLRPKRSRSLISTRGSKCCASDIGACDHNAVAQYQRSHAVDDDCDKKTLSLSYLFLGSVRCSKKFQACDQNAAGAVHIEGIHTQVDVYIVCAKLSLSDHGSRKQSRHMSGCSGGAAAVAGSEMHRLTRHDTCVLPTSCPRSARSQPTPRPSGCRQTTSLHHHHYRAPCGGLTCGRIEGCWTGGHRLGCACVLG